MSEQIKVKILKMVLLIAGIVFAYMFYDIYRVEKPPIYTENELAQEEYEVLVYYYHMISDPDLEDLEKQRNNDYTYVKLSPSEDTDKAIEVLNCLLFESEFYQEKYPEIESYAAEYGITRETPITREWLINSNRDAISIMKLVHSRRFGDLSYVRSTYDKIIAEREEEQ